jgi:hypothetical protein
MTVIYRITELGAPTRGGMNAAIDVSIGGVAKTNDECEYTIANEVIAERIGQTLGLPIPSGVIAEDDSKRLYYCSLDVSKEGKKLPPVIPADFVRDETDLAAGVFVFDVLIANGDRNTSNLSRDPAFTPPRVSVFDHGHALLGTNPPIGPDRLRLATDRLGCADDSAHIASDSILLDQALDPACMERWVKRVRQVPGYVFEDACTRVAQTPGLNIDAATASTLANWLIKRAEGLGDLIWNNKGSLPAVAWSLWGPGGQP